MKKNQVPQLTNDIISSTIKFLEKSGVFENNGLISALPLGKVGAFLTRRIIEISDPEKALLTAIGTSFFTSFIEAVNFFNLNRSLPDGISEVLIFKVETSFKYSFKASEFDINNFVENKISARYFKIFKRVLIEYQIATENRIKILKFIEDYAELNFYIVLEHNPATYETATTLLKSRSYEIKFKNRKIEYYKTELKNLINEPVWGDKRGLTLNDLYIKPQFKLHQYCFKKDDKRVFFKKPKDDKGFVKFDYPYDSIHEYIHHILLGNKDELDIKSIPQFILLLGYPGQGKTSFCKKMLYDTYSQSLPLGKDVFFVKFKNINRVKELINDPLKTLTNKINEQVDVDFNGKKIKRSILLLDGLDELYMKENMQKNEIDEFIKNFIKEIEQYAELKVIITCRYGYLDLSKLKERNVLICQLREFAIEEQNSWLSNYKAYHPNCILTKDKLIEIHHTKNLKHLAELIRQPILLHMIARLPKEISRNDNRAKIYDKLFETLVKREYDVSSEQIENLKGPNENDLRKLIREIAFEIFKSGGEYIHKNDLENLDAVKKFMGKLENQHFNDALKGLMIAFYFQEVKKEEEDQGLGEEKRQDYAIEFLHKSLQEYLVAEKVWDSVKDFLDKNRNDDYFIDKFSSAMDNTYPLFAYQELSKEIIDYLSEIILNDKTTNTYELHQRLTLFFPYYIRTNFLKEYNFEKQPKYSAYYLANNHFYGYWTLVSNLSFQNIIPENKELLNILVSQIKTISNEGKKINLSGQIFYEVNFNRVQFANMKLKEAEFVRVKFNRADLLGANLSKTKLIKAQLEGADINHANLSYSDISEANLNDADLTRSELSRANLTNAYFINSKLGKAVCIKANFSFAKLSYSVLVGAKLMKATLIECQLSHAILDTADLTEADLTEADLTNAALRDVELTGANLTRAELKETILKRSDFSGAILTEADFTKADVEGADFTRAVLKDVEFNEIRNLTVKQLIQSATLKGCKNLDPILKQGIIDEGHGYLFEE